jgi:hypothetical protein
LEGELQGSVEGKKVRAGKGKLGLIVVVSVHMLLAWVREKNNWRWQGEDARV